MCHHLVCDHCYRWNCTLLLDLNLGMVAFLLSHIPSVREREGRSVEEELPLPVPASNIDLLHVNVNVHIRRHLVKD
jgi:hypothetical protein